MSMIEYSLPYATCYVLTAALLVSYSHRAKEAIYMGELLLLATVWPIVVAVWWVALINKFLKVKL